MLVLSGEIDLSTAEMLQGRALQWLSDGARALTFDFGGVTFMDSAGLSALVAIHRAADAVDAPLYARRFPDGVARILRFTALDSLFAAEPVAAVEDTSGHID